MPSHPMPVPFYTMQTTTCQRKPIFFFCVLSEWHVWIGMVWCRGVALLIVYLVPTLCSVGASAVGGTQARWQHELILNML